MVDDATASKIQALQQSLVAGQRDLQQSIAIAQRSIESEVRHLGSRVESTIRLVNDLQSELNLLKAQINSYIREERLARNMQFAKTALIDVRAERDRKFGHHEALRRSTIGMLQAMDVGIVTESTLQQTSERLMIDAPRYWLAPVQVSLAAWIRDSRAVAERALLEAMAREPNKSALFFTLVLARHQRYDASAQWIYEYVNQQDCMALSSEFVIVLDAAHQGALGGRAPSLLKEQCISWYEQLSSYESVSRAQIVRWRSRLNAQRKSLAAEFRTLPQLSPDWSNTLDLLEGTTVHGESEQMLRARFAAPITQHNDLRYRIDRILRSLVSAYDEEEAPLLVEEARWNAVIDAHGDHSQASPPGAIDHESESEPQPDFLTLLTNIGLNPERTGASAMTEQFALALASDWITTAAQELASNSTSERPESIPIQILGWSRDLNPRDGEAVTDDFVNFVDRKTHEEISKVTVYKQRASVIAATIILALSIAALPFRTISQTFDLGFGGVAILLCIGTVVWLLRAHRNLPGRKEYVRNTGETQKEQGVLAIQAALSEVRKLHEVWDREMAKKDSLIEFVRGEASRAAQLPTPALENITPESVAPNAQLPHQQVPERRTEALGEASDSDSLKDSFALRLPNWDLLPPTSWKPS